MRRIFILLLVLGILIVSACAKETKKPEEPSEPAEPTGSSGTADSQGSSESAVPGTYRQITQTEAAEMMKTETDYILLDVRTNTEYLEGHISGAICIPNETIMDQEPHRLPDKNQLILVYCRSGRRSKEAAQKLADMGYTNIVEFGGILDWTGEIVTN